jgi:purine nucleosidase
MNIRPFLIDTDTASDDAVALIMALRAPVVRVLAITTVAGNVGLQRATANALYTVELCQAEVPVYAGAAKPLCRPLEDASWFHGRDGLGDHGYRANRAPEKEHAVDALIRVVEANPGITLVTLGPLTNIALALESKPSIVGNIGRCVVMGGNPCCVGNVTPAAEFNFWADPEAARMVIRSGLKVELIGWHLCRGEAALNASDIDFVLGLGTDRARFAIECNSRARQAYLKQTGEDGIALPDPVTMAIALDPSIGTAWSNYYVDVETGSDLTRGLIVVDQLEVAGDERNRDVWSPALETASKTRVCWTIDNRRWKQALYAALR